MKIDDGGYKSFPVGRKSATGLESNLFYINGSSVSRHEAETIYRSPPARLRPIRTTNISH
ncbi:hypothetical protein Hanom_Chr14g01327231 [Helianthus anomalus]